jgi:hypothetical protein
VEARLQEVARHRGAHDSGAENRDPLSHQQVTLSATAGAAASDRLEEMPRERRAEAGATR